MADVTFGVKVTPELKDRIEQLVKESDFDTNKEWFQHLLSVYELHQLKHQDGTKRYASELNHIEFGLTRIQETIVEMMKRTADEVTHQENEWIKLTESLQQQLQQSEQTRKDLEAKLSEAKDQIKLLNESNAEMKKQSILLDELTTTLKKSLTEKESELEKLKTEHKRFSSFDYPTEIQRLREEKTTLERQLQMQQHQINLTRMEYEGKMELLQLRVDFAAKENQLLHRARINPPNEKPNVTARKRGRPKKEEHSKPDTEQPETTNDISEELEIIDWDPYPPNQSEFEFETPEPYPAPPDEKDK